MARPRLNVEIGKHYGNVTVESPAPMDKTGHIRYNVLCDCGTRFETSPHKIMKGTMCESCLRKMSAQKRINKWLGQTVGTWEVKAYAGRSECGTQQYYCRCSRCGNISIKSIGAIKRNNNGCVKCPPDYGFQIIGDTAVGKLPDGTEFIIDKDMMNAVGQLYWHKEPDGYITCTQKGMPKLMLHRFIAGADDESMIVDHINRNRLDCRRSNLRIVTAQQNSMNKSLQKNSTTGYAGVVYLKNKKRYRSVIGLNDRRIYLLTSKSAEECAQAYNCAADLIFGDYRGHTNDVPDPQLSLRRLIEERCRPYRYEAFAATQPCGFFDAAEGL